MVFGGLKGFSRIFSDVEVEPKYSDVKFEMLYCERRVRVSGNLLLESSDSVGVGDWGMLK